MRTISGTILLLVLATSQAGAQGRKAAPIDLTGKWALTVVTQGQPPASAEVTLIQRKDSLIGRYTSQTLGDLEVVGSVKDRDFSFSYSTTMNGQPLTFMVKGIVQTPDSLSGTATMGMLGAATFTAKRQPARP